MTTQNNPMSGQISICLDKVTSQHVNVIFSSDKQTGCILTQYKQRLPHVVNTD